MKQDFVTFYSPGTFVAEQTTREVANWNVTKARQMLSDIEERHGARPYGFQFHTKKRGWRDFEPKEVKRSGMYYVNCRVQTVDEVEAEGQSVLADNMRTNGWDRVVTTTRGWSWSQPFKEGDTVL